jgi:hypothetical protein
MPHFHSFIICPVSVGTKARLDMKRVGAEQVTRSLVQFLTVHELELSHLYMLLSNQHSPFSSSWNSLSEDSFAQDATAQKNNQLGQSGTPQRCIIIVKQNNWKHFSNRVYIKRFCFRGHFEAHKIFQAHHEATFNDLNKTGVTMNVLH